MSNTPNVSPLNADKISLPAKKGHPAVAPGLPIAPKGIPPAQGKLTGTFSLLKADTSFNKLSPFTVGFFGKIANSFNAFFRWVARKPDALKVKGLELAFAMEVYHSSDELLVELSKNGIKTPDSLQYSTLLALWTKFIKKTTGKTEANASFDKKELKEIASLLRKSVSIQKSIEKIDALPEQKQLGAYKKLHKSTLKKLTRLKQGEKCYIPGAVRDENGIHYLMYEVKKNNNQYEFRAFGVLEDKNTDLQTANIFKDDEELKQGVTLMLASAIDWKGMQGPERFEQELQDIMALSSKSPKEIFLEIGKSPLKYFKKFKTLIGFKAGLKLATSSKFRKDYLEEGGFLKVAIDNDVRFADPGGLRAHINEDNLRAEKFSSEKTIEVFLKSLQPELGSTLKIALKTSLLEEIFKKSKKHLHKFPDLRKELQHELENLYAAINKYQDDLDLDPCKQTIIDLLDLLDDIDEKDRILPPSPSKQKGVKTSFKSLMKMPSDVPSLKSFKAVQPNTQVPVLNDALPVLAFDSADNIVKSLNETKDYCQAQIMSKNYLNLDAALTEVIDQLATVNLDGLVDDQTESAKASLSFFAVALTHCHFALKREGISASVYKQLSVLASKFDPDFFNTSSASSDFFTNPYLDLGIYATSEFKDSCNRHFDAIADLDFNNFHDFQEKSILSFDPDWIDQTDIEEEEKGKYLIGYCIAALVAGECTPQKSSPVIKDDAVAARIVEAVITDDGNEPKQLNVPALTPAGLAQTPMPYKRFATAHSILEEKYCFKGLPMDVSAELQLMQTDPNSSSRIKYAMGAFSKIAGIFGDSKIGFDWQRVFSIQLTQNAALDRLITSEPEYALVYLDTLRSMIEDVQASGNVGAALFLMRIHRESLPLIEKLLEEIQSGSVNASDEASALIDSRLEKMLEHIVQDFDQIQIWQEKAESEAAAVAKSGKVTNILRNRFLIHQQFLYHCALNNNLPQDHELYQDIDEDVLKNIFTGGFILQQVNAPSHSVPLDVERTVNHLLWKTSEAISSFLSESDLDDLQTWLVPLLPPEAQDKIIEEAEYPLFHVEEYTIDVEKKVLYIHGKAKRLIPAAIAGDKKCEAIFGETMLFSIRAGYKNVRYKKNDIEKLGEQYSFKFNGERYCIIAKEDEDLLIYKQCQPPGHKKPSWFLFQDITFLSSENWDAEEAGFDEDTPKPPRQYIPNDVQNNLHWVKPKGQTIFAEGPDKGDSYFISLSKKVPKSWHAVEADDFRLRSAARIVPAGASKTARLLNPWAVANFKIFQTLDHHDHIIAKGDKGKVNEIAYKRMNLSYKWDKSKKCWRAVQFPGFSLSGKKIRSFIKTDNQTKSGSLFPSNFNDYQIIEHAAKLPKLLLNGCEYVRGTDRDIYKNFQSLDPENSLLFIYDIDPQIGLKCQSPTGYLYLSYVLFTQKRYTEALAYLQKANSLDIQKAAEFTKIVDWMRAWEDESPEGQAFSLHFEHQMMELMRIQNPRAFADEAVQKRIRKLSNKIDSYKASQDKIPSNLQLSKSKKISLKLTAELDLLSAQERASDFVDEHPEFATLILHLKGKGAKEEVKQDLFGQLAEFEEALDAAGLSAEEFQAYAEADLLDASASKKERIQKLLVIEKQHGFRLLKVLQSDIEVMEAKIAANKPPKAKKKAKISPAVSKSVFPKAFLDSFIDNKPANLGNAEEKIQKFEDTFSEEKDNEFLQEKGSQQAEDTRFAVQNLDTLRALKSDADIKLLIDKLLNGDKKMHLAGYQPLRKEVKKHRDAIIKLFQVDDVDAANDWEAVKKRIEKREDSLTQLFSRARFCYAANDFSELINEGFLNHEDVPALKKQMRYFLEKDSKRQQYMRALEKVQQIADGGEIEILGPQLIQILDQKRAYSVKNDKHSALIAVFEWDRGYVATPDQIHNLKVMVTRANLFKLEALAGGKTAVIRNLIAEFKADGYHLSGVVTHVPLMEMHHPLLEQAARESYGRKVLTFSFSRKSPTDRISLTHTLYFLNQMIVEKGRLDLNKRDLLSLHHAVLLKWDQLQVTALGDGVRHDPSKPMLDLTVQKEIDVCNKILDLLENHLVLGSDEADTILTNDEEHIFAYGGKMPLTPKKIEGAWQIMKWILTDPSLDAERSAFRANKQCKFSEQQRQDFLDKIAALAHRDIAPDLDKEELANYLLVPLAEGETSEFYETEILGHRKADELKVLKKYLQDILTESTLRKEGGVNFGRSKEDGWLVKPYEFSDSCREDSQQSSEEETIWFTLCNYLDNSVGGVKADQIAELVHTKQAEAAKEVKNARRLDKIVSFSETEAALAWDEDFDIPLIEVIPEQYQKIADEINKSPELLEKFLLHYVFPKNSTSLEKIGANAHDFVEMVAEFYGSAGTAEAAPTFPKKIKLIKELVTQKGVNGRVLWALMKTFQPGDIMYSDDVLETLGQEMKEGDALIDLQPAFPGLSGKTIAEKVASKLQEKNKLSPDGIIAFLDSQNEPRAIDLSTGGESPLPANRNINKTTNILAQKDTRGTNIEMADDSVGYLTIGPNTSYTAFLQADLRMRKLPQRLLSDSEMGQKIRYVLDPCLKDILGPTPTFEKLKKYLISNEISKLKNSIYKTEKQDIEACLRVNSFKGLRKITDYEARRIVWGQVRPFFIQKAQTSIEEGGRPNQLLPPLDVLKALAGKKREQTEEMIALIEGAVMDNDDLSEETKEDVGKFIQHLKKIEKDLAKKEEGKELPKAKYMPDKVSTSPAELDMHQTSEQEQELEMEMQQQQQQTNVEITGTPVTNPRPKLHLKLENPSSLCDRLYEINEDEKNVDLPRVFQSLKRSVPYIDKYSYFTRGGYPIYAQDPWQQYDPAKAGQIQIPRFLLMVDKRHNPARVVSVIGTQNDFLEIDEFAKTHKNDRKIDVYVVNIRNDRLDAGKYDWETDYSAEVRETIARRLIQMKFLNGEIDLLNPSADEGSPIRQEYQAFELWLMGMIDDGLANAEELEKVFLQFLQAYRPSQVPQYHTSAVAEVFETLKSYVPPEKEETT